MMKENKTISELNRFVKIFLVFLYNLELFSKTLKMQLIKLKLFLYLKLLYRK